jgi:UDP-N-acetylglucosamine 4,6-dehydratase
MVTGATGSFGRRCVHALLHRYRLRRLVVFSRDEMKQAAMGEVYSDREFDCLRYFIGDVRDQSRMELAMRGIDFVIHAAAMKIVPIAEYNPFECVRTNINGAENVVRAAINAGVKRVVALSTDKAVNPINLYGATKLAAEKIFIAANAISGYGGTQFAVARYGNVLGSRGSVIELFRRLIAEKASSLPITDPRMTRFWISLDQGVDFVLRTLATAKGGEVLVPKLPTMRIVDLARHMAPRLPQHVVGIRAGEKLHETLLASGEARNAREFPDRYVVLPQFVGTVRDDPAYADGRSLPEDFEYASDKNSWWLSPADLSTLLNADPPS